MSAGAKAEPEDDAGWPRMDMDGVKTEEDAPSSPVLGMNRSGIP